MVWDCREAEVTAGDQVRVLEYLDRAGTAPLAEVETVIRCGWSRRWTTAKTPA
jgi:hypothetical protein